MSFRVNYSRYHPNFIDQKNTVDLVGFIIIMRSSYEPIKAKRTMSRSKNALQIIYFFAADELQILHDASRKYCVLHTQTLNLKYVLKI